ncbi:MAG TPA: cupin domain-containing protein [Elainellaceae cyanobacterium]
MMNLNAVPPLSCMLRSPDIQAMPEVVNQHTLNPNAIRHTRSLGDAVGLSRIGIHLVRVEPGHETTQFHFHHCEEEFLYILSGRGIASIGDTEIEVSTGDFMGFTAPSIPHSLRNPFDQDLVYLMGGERKSFDVCDYPRLRKRLVRLEGDRTIVDWENLETIQTLIELPTTEL